MTRQYDMTGETWGKWYVDKYDEETSKRLKGSHYHCICRCGTRKIKGRSDLIQGKSLGCIKCRGKE